jgi:hypothetical protein
MNETQRSDAMGITQIIYRCRLCGEVFESTYDERQSSNALGMLNGRCIDAHYLYPMHHECAGEFDGSVGYCDVVGFNRASMVPISRATEPFGTA